MPTANPQIDITEDDDAGWSGPRTTLSASAEPSDDDPETDGTPPAEGEGESAVDSAPVEEEPAEDAIVVPPKAETAEQKAQREKDEQIAGRWKLVEKAKAEHIRVAARQKELDASTAKLDQERQQFALERQTHARVVQEAQGIVELVQQVRANPTIQGLRRLGFDYSQLTTEMVEAGTPEALARAAHEEARRLREEIQQRDRSTASAAANRNDAQRLVAHVEQNEELYPDLATYPPEKIAEDGLALRDQHLQQHKRYPSFQWVIEQLQEKAKAFEDSRKARAAKRAGGTPSEEASQASVNGNGRQANRPTGKPSIGNAAVTSRASAPRQPTEAEIDEWALSQLRGLKGVRR